MRRKALPYALRSAVWRKYIGAMLDGVCFVCESAPITFGGNVEYGHVRAVACGGEDSVDNLRPICAACNRGMGTRDLLEYKAQLTTMGLAHIPNPAHNQECAGALICSAFVPDALILDDLHVLSDAQVRVLAHGLDIDARTTAEQREMIASRMFTLPIARKRSARTCEKIRALVGAMDEMALLHLFGMPPQGSSGNIRAHALHMMGV